MWWSNIANKLTVWQVPSEQSQELAKLAQRSMVLQVSMQDGTIWVGDGERSVEIVPVRLMGAE